MIDKRELRLYGTMLKIGFIGFGGGSALVPVIEKEVVDEQHLISKEEYDKDVVVASVTPGALPMEIAAGIGKRCYGIRGMFGTAVLMSAPGALLTLLLLTVLNSVGGAVLDQISFLSIGITSFISCMLTGYITKTVSEAKQTSKRREFFTMLIIIGVLVLTMEKNLYKLFGIDFTPIFGLSTIQVLAMAFFVVFYTRGAFNKINVSVSAVLLVLFWLCKGQRHYISNEYIAYTVQLVMIVLSVWGFAKSLSEKSATKVPIKVLGKELSIWVLFAVLCAVPAIMVTTDSLLLMGRGIFSSIMSFGGGDAYLIVADGLMVETGMVTADYFYGKLVPIVNLLPGSILCKTLTGIGYFMGYDIAGSQWQGLLVALMAYSSSVMASGAVFCAGYYVFQRFKKLNVFHLITRMIKPIISGLLFGVILALVRQNTSIGTTADFGALTAVLVMLGIYILDVFMSLKKCSNAVIVTVSGILSLIICNVLQFVF